MKNFLTLLFSFLSLTLAAQPVILRVQLADQTEAQDFQPIEMRLGNRPMLSLDDFWLTQLEDSLIMSHPEYKIPQAPLANFPHFLQLDTFWVRLPLRPQAQTIHKMELISASQAPEKKDTLFLRLFSNTDKLKTLTFFSPYHKPLFKIKPRLLASEKSQPFAYSAHITWGQHQEGYFLIPNSTDTLHLQPHDFWQPIYLEPSQLQYRSYQDLKNIKAYLSAQGQLQSDIKTLLQERRRSQDAYERKAMEEGFVIMDYENKLSACQDSLYFCQNKTPRPKHDIPMPPPPPPPHPEPEIRLAPSYKSPCPRGYSDLESYMHNVQTQKIVNVPRGHILIHISINKEGRASTRIIYAAQAHKDIASTIADNFVVVPWSPAYTNSKSIQSNLILHVEIK